MSKEYGTYFMYYDFFFKELIIFINLIEFLYSYN